MLRSLVDRFALWLGYVPADRLGETIVFCDCEGDDCKYEPQTMTTVKPRPAIIVSADFNRGHPCS